jgi:hypothetical protein
MSKLDFCQLFDVYVNELAILTDVPWNRLSWHPRLPTAHFPLATSTAYPDCRPLQGTEELRGAALLACDLHRQYNVSSSTRL